MTFFTKFKKAKEAAVEHKRTAAAQQAKPPAAPYKHIPTHAAQDALAAQPTRLRPEEMQARVAAARKRGAHSSRPSLAPRHSVYHSCESSRASSRTNSSAAFPPVSFSSSLKGKSKSDVAMEAAMQRPQSLPYQHSSQWANGHLQPSELLPAVPGRPPPFPLPTTQRPRPYRTVSSRSSYTKKKSPLSNISVDEESPNVFLSSSNTSAASTQSSGSDDMHRNNGKDRSVDKNTTMVETSSSNKQKSTVNVTQLASKTEVKRRSRWSILPRKNIDIAAH